MIDNLAIGLVLGLIGIGVVGILVSGIRNVINGKSDLKRVGIMGVPVAVFAISYASLGTANQAGVATMLFMIGVMLVGIVITGTRGTFKF
ncbi:hypothetical protein [Rhodohalobacter halophilus]|uniref:hypothetical protein n=1 Tax=Rhodohalobacter halophilus TaxID=1812810 RepID=UPI00083FABFE|nr:hypothetical protein [Rhodohalobacter halophilus]